MASPASGSRATSRIEASEATIRRNSSAPGAGFERESCGISRPKAPTTSSSTVVISLISTGRAMAPT